MLMSRNRRAEVRRSSYWAEFPAEERKRRTSVFTRAERKTVSERRSSKWKSKFQQILGRQRPSSAQASFQIEAMLKTGWEERRTLDGNVYYFELDTGRVRWDKPDELKSEKEKEEDAAEWVWVPHPTNVWQPGKVKSREKNGEVTVRTMDNKTVKIPHIGIMKGKLTGGVSQKVPLWPLKRAALDRIEEDLVALPALDEGMIMHNLRVRYEDGEIYTWVGSSRTVLISVNPFQDLPIYGPQVIEVQRMGQQAQALGRKLVPHVYGIANDSLEALLGENKSQSILVSGESGAGKTHATKQCLDFLAHVAASRKEGERNSGRRFEMTMVASTGVDTDQKVEHKVLVANPVLEAFGNAKTVRNNNSSRFGKWIAVYLNRQTKQINGAQITSFLLESSRVTMQAKTERNYHIFYQLMTDEDVVERYSLHGGSESFHYLNQSGSTTADGIDDGKEFDKVVQALEQLGFEDEEQEWLMRTTAAVLHLGNVDFVEIKLPNGQQGCKLNDELHSTVVAANQQDGAVDRKKSVAENPGEKDAEEQDEETHESDQGATDAEDDANMSKARWALERASELLDIEMHALEKVLTQRSIVVRGEHSTIPLKTRQAVQARDSLAKAVYSRLFDWLVNRVNESFGNASGKFIGILDIFGFEIFEHNSFEQLCINYANERLQQLFNQHTFGDEEELYEIEKIHFRRIKFQDNQPVLDLIDKKPDGVLNLLDDECVVPGGTDLRLMGRIDAIHKDNKFYQSAGSAKGKNVARGNDEPLNFSIKHFAGVVTYDVRGFMAKNSDTLFQDLYDICSKSEDSLTQDLFPVLEENDRIKVISQSGKFRAQLSDLMRVLGKTQSRYIRCIKPNAEQAPNHFDGRKCLEQLRASGVFEAVEIRKTGYPFRLLHDEFVRRYRCINTGYSYRSGNTTDSEIKALCLEILDASPQKFAGVQVGEMRVLYRVEDHKMLELLRDLALATEVPRIQAAWRRALAVKLRNAMFKAERRLKKAMNEDEPDLSTLESAIEEVPEILGSVGVLFKINPPSLAAAKHLHAGLEQWEDVEEEMEEFEDVENKSSLDVGKAESVIASADRLRDEGYPMTERQKELYDHIKELLVGGSVEDLDTKVNEALETMEREKVEVVSKEAGEWARSTEALDKVKETASRFKKLDEDARRAIKMVDRVLLERVKQEAEELEYSDETIDEVNRLLGLDEFDFVQQELKSAKQCRDKRRQKHRKLRLRELFFAKVFPDYSDFFSFERVRGQTSTASSCTASLFGGRSKPKPSKQPDSSSLEEFAESRSGGSPSEGSVTRKDDQEQSPASNTKMPSPNPRPSSPRDICFTTRLTTSVTILHRKSDVKEALRVFENIKTYMGDSRRSTSNAKRNVAGLKVLEAGLKNEYLRDEIYVQLVMQLTKNPSESSVMAGVDLLCLTVAAFAPSDEPLENFFTVWVKLRMPDEFYSTIVSTLHDHRFTSHREELNNNLIRLINLDRSAFEGEKRETSTEAEADFEIIKAGHGLEGLRNRFKSFESGSRFSQKFAWETDPWERNPAFRRSRDPLLPDNFRVRDLKGFVSSIDDSNVDTITRAASVRLKARMSQLSSSFTSSMRSVIEQGKQAGSSSGGRGNRSGSVVEVGPSTKERVQASLGKLTGSFRKR